MDIAGYVSELLGELGEVNVPGLGNFTQQKIKGHYNDAENKFYPPAHEVRYDPQFVDDDILAEYIAEKKKISLASSKYFIEKYVNSVKQEAILQDVALADMGWLRFEVHEFHFKSAGDWVSDPAFFGYPQIELKKLGSTSFLDQMEALTAAPKDVILSPPVLQEENVSGTDVVATDAEVNEPVPVAPEANEIASPVSPDEPVQEAETVAQEKPVEDTEAIMPEESVKTPETEKFDLEAYLRELEAGAGIIQPQEVISEPEPEVISQQPQAEITHPEIEPEPETPEPEPVTDPELKVDEHIIDVPLPETERAPYTPDPELQKYILDPAPAETEPADDKHLVTPVHVAVQHPEIEEDFVFDGKGYDEVDNRPGRSYTGLWITLILILILGGAAGYIWYMHQQKVIKMIKANTVPIPLKVPLKPDTSKAAADSLKDTIQNAVIKDTTVKAVTVPISASAIDSTKVRYELIGVSVPSLAAANRCVVNYKSIGISDAHVLIPGQGMGRLIKVSLATFNNRPDAINKKRELLKTGNVREITILKINPKK